MILINKYFFYRQPNVSNEDAKICKKSTYVISQDTNKSKQQRQLCTFVKQNLSSSFSSRSTRINGSRKPETIKWRFDNYLRVNSIVRTATNRCSDDVVSKRLNHWRRDSPLTLPNGGRYLPRAAVRSALERFPIFHSFFLPTSTRWRGLRRRHTGLRRLFVYGSQGRPVGL